MRISQSFLLRTKEGKSLSSIHGGCREKSLERLFAYLLSVPNVFFIPTKLKKLAHFEGAISRERASDILAVHFAAAAIDDHARNVQIVALTARNP